jgi:hypothetical protein
VLEARAIARCRPHFNRRLKQPGRHAWVRFDPRDPFPAPRRHAAGRRRPVASPRTVPRRTRARRRARPARGRARAPHLRRRLRPDPNGRACLRLDLGQCSGPCVARCTPGEYGPPRRARDGGARRRRPGVARASGARALHHPRAPGAGRGRAAGAARRAARTARCSSSCRRSPVRGTGCSRSRAGSSAARSR